MSRLSVNFAESDSRSRRRPAGAGIGGSILLWACLCALAYVALRFFLGAGR